MRVIDLGKRRKTESLVTLSSQSFAAFEKSVDLAAKFGFSNLQGCCFSRDYQYFFLFTQGSAVAHHVLNVVDINDVDTWTLKETWGDGDYRAGYVGIGGSKVYAGIANSLLQFNQSTPYLMSTKTQAAAIVVAGGSFVKGVNMNPSETKLFINRAGTTAESELREFDISPSGDIAGATFVQSVMTSTANENGFKWVNNGNAVLTILLSSPNNVTRIRNVTTPYTLNGLSAPITVPTDSIGGTDLEINGSQTKIYTIVNTGVLAQYSVT